MLGTSNLLFHVTTQNLRDASSFSHVSFVVGVFSRCFPQKCMCLFGGFRYWCGWAYSDSLVQLTFLLLQTSTPTMVEIACCKKSQWSQNHSVCHPCLEISCWLKLDLPFCWWYSNHTLSTLIKTWFFAKSLQGLNLTNANLKCTNYQCNYLTPV